MMVVRGHSQPEPLTPALSPQGRGGESPVANAPSLTSPLRGEVAPKGRVRSSVSQARALRSTPTDAEARLWSILRSRQLNGCKFTRQFAIGPYVADFVCREAALIVEVDGGQHADSARDERRTAFLCAQGYSVLRFWNNEVLANLEGVRSSIASTLALDPSPDLRFAPATLSPQGRGTGGARAATTKQRSYRLNAEPINE